MKPEKLAKLKFMFLKMRLRLRLRKTPPMKIVNLDQRNAVEIEMKVGRRI